MDMKSARDVVREAAPKIFRADRRVRGVGLGVGDGKYTLNVLRNPGRRLPHNSPAGPLQESVSDLPVRIIETHRDPKPMHLLAFHGPGSPVIQPSLPEQFEHRNLYCGVQIQNFHEDERRGLIASNKISVGTLGCFALSSQNKICLLSNAHVIGNRNGAHSGDSILQPGDVVVGINDENEIAKLEQFSYPVASPTGALPGDPVCVLNTIDAATAQLTSGLLSRSGYHQEFLPATGAPLPPTSPVHAYSYLQDEEVFKVGRSTGLRYGKTNTIAMQIVFSYDHGDCWFEDVIAIESADPSLPFSGAGDSGSVVLRRNSGEIIGLLFGGDDQLTYASSINPVLQKLNCSLI